MADLTINYQREMVVDFTMPFLDLGMTNDFSKSTTIVPTHRSFISELRNRLIIKQILFFMTYSTLFQLSSVKAVQCYLYH